MTRLPVAFKDCCQRWVVNRFDDDFIEEPTTAWVFPIMADANLLQLLQVNGFDDEFIRLFKQDGQVVL